MGNPKQYKIHPIVTGTKTFDKGMMTHQHDYGKPYTIPIYCWYIEGGDKKILVDTGELAPLQSKEKESAIGGKRTGGYPPVQIYKTKRSCFVSLSLPGFFL
jgi:hypothetical protein